MDLLVIKFSPAFCYSRGPNILHSTQPVLEKPSIYVLPLDGETKFNVLKVGITLGYGMDDRGSRLRFPGGGGLGVFLFTAASRTVLGPTQPPIQWVSGALSFGVKRPGREADHSHLVPRSIMRGAILPLPQYVFMAWCLVKHRDNFIFTFTLKTRGKFVLIWDFRQRIGK
jgi:hypothetical protein